MSLKNKIVVDTKISNVTLLNGPGQRLYQEITIEYSDFQFHPGQFVMIKKDSGSTCWAYPYMIQRKVEYGFVVFAAENTSLYEAVPGLSLVVWGANGRPVMGDDNMVVLTEEAACFFATPFLEAETCRHSIVISPDQEHGFLNRYKNITFVKDISEMSEVLNNFNYSSLIAALNMQNILSLVSRNQSIDAKKLQVFASTTISCGVDGCKSCYLHSDKISLGISVCCNGPYLPYEKIDFETNKRCFHVFK